MLNKKIYFKPIWYMFILIIAILIVLVLNNNKLHAATLYGNPSNPTVYSQGDDEWATYPYNKMDGTKKNIKQSGCGLVSFTNMILYLNGEEIDPKFLADESRKNGYRVETGTDPRLYKFFCDKYGALYGISFVKVSYDFDELIKYLNQGCVANIGGRNHRMCIVDYNSNTDKFLVLNSATWWGKNKKAHEWYSRSEVFKMALEQFYIVKSTKKTDIFISTKTTDIKNSTVKFIVNFNLKIPLQRVDIFYGTDKSHIKSITKSTKLESKEGYYKHKYLWKCSNIQLKDEWSFDTKNETAKHIYVKLSPGKKYYYKILVKLANGDSYISNINSFTMKADKPAAVTSLTVDHTDGKYAKGDQIAVNWNSSKDATGYNVYLYNAQDAEVSRITNCINTTCKMTAPAVPGTYKVKVFAYNEAGDSKESSKTLQVMDNLSLTFRYGDDGATPDEAMAVKYNGSIKTPAVPTRTGYTFLGWVSEKGKVYGGNSSITNITKNETFTADWRINKYKVKILDGYNNDQLCGAVTLEYGTIFDVAKYLRENGVTLPEHAGYSHVGFNEEYYRVTAKSEQEVYALYRWTSLNKVETSITEIARAREEVGLQISDGYSVDVDVKAIGTATGGTNQPIKGRVIVALKTGAGRLLIETESAAFVIYPKTTDVIKTINVFVPYESTDPSYYPEHAEAFVVSNYSSGGIISAVANGDALLAEANADELGWSYTTEEITGNDQVLSDGSIVSVYDHNQDRYEYTKNVTVYKTAFGNAEPDYKWQSEEWKPFCSGTVRYVKSWPELGSGSGCGFNNTSGTGKELYNTYNNSKVSAVVYPTRRVVTDTNTPVVGYIYYHWCRGLNNGDLEHAVKKTNRITGDGAYVYNKFECFYSDTVLPQETYLDSTYYSARSVKALQGKSKDSYFWFRIAVCEQRWSEEYKITTWKKESSQAETYPVGTVPEGGKIVQGIDYSITSLVDGSKKREFTESSAELNYTTVSAYTQGSKQYAFKPKEYSSKHEDINLHDAMTLSVGIENAGKEGVVYIYKDRQVADYTTEYISGVTVDENGMITIAGFEGGQLQTREDISPETGAFTVAVALYGETNARILKTIEIPDDRKPEYSVTFVADTVSSTPDGSLQVNTVTVETQQIREGRNAEAPAESLLPVREGWHFTGWNESLNNICEDMMVHAVYEQNVHSVVFVDWEGRSIDVEKRLYGDAVAAPELPSAPEGFDVHWVILGDDGSTVMTLQEFEDSGNGVTGDMVVAAEYFTKMLDLTVVSFDDALSSEGLTLKQQEEILAETSEMDLDQINSADSIEKYPTNTYSYEYSDIIDLDVYEEPYDQSIVFIGWKNAAKNSELLESSEITDDMTIYPVYRFADTVEMPEADLPEGEYEEAQEVTLTCETEGAVIYYTLDGSDPAASDTAVEYTGPVTLDKSCTLKACAMALGMNTSITMEAMYAVNIGDGIPCHLVTVYARDLGEDLDGYIFKALVRDGAKLDISGIEDVEHYTYGGLYYDESYEDEFIVESETVTESLELYARYIPETLTVTFTDEDGTEYSHQSVSYGDIAEVPENPGKAGYIFVGWDPNVEEPVYTDMTFIAVFVSEDEYATVKLNRTNIGMVVGGSKVLRATVAPEGLDVDLLWESSNENVVEVDEYGKLIAVSQGEAEVTVTVKSTREKATCKVTVTKNSDESIVLARNSSLDIDTQGYIRRVSEGKNTVSELRDQFINENLLFLSPDGSVLEETDLAGTGTLVRLADAETVLDEARIVMTGDVDGDGWVRNRDAAMVGQIALAVYSPEEWQGLAADVNGDGNVNEVDSSVITQYLVGKTVIG